MSSQTQNVQRGLIFLVFLQIIFYMLLIIYKFCKNTLDPVEGAQGSEAGEGQREGKYKDSEAKGAENKESMDKIESDPNFDKVAVQTDKQPDEESPIVQRIFHSLNEYRNLYTPITTLAILNIVTGTSKAFCLILYFFAVLWLLVFNLCKVHRKCCGDNKVVNALVQNVWLILTFFFFVNLWAAFTIQMPYSVRYP